jgi:hypothetical protein
VTAHASIHVPEGLHPSLILSICVCMTLLFDSRDYNPFLSVIALQNCVRPIVLGALLACHQTASFAAVEWREFLREWMPHVLSIHLPRNECSHSLNSAANSAAKRTGEASLTTLLIKIQMSWQVVGLMIDL